MKQVLFKKRRVLVEEVPAPQVSPGHVLVRVVASCISSGTEAARLLTSSQPLLQRVRLEGWGVVQKALRTSRVRGAHGLFRLLEEKMRFGSPTGYSCAGYVEEVGIGVTGFQRGDAVACAGPGYAHHAEVVSVPKILVVQLPPGLDVYAGATMAVGSIALHGVRRLQPQLGETVGVMGLGVMGQIAAQILKTSGCKVLGLDPDPHRLQLAQSLGLDHGWSPEAPGLEETVLRLTEGHGADAFLVAAASETSEPVQGAIRLCRRKGKVVVLGEVGLNLDRGEMHRKEIDLLMSASYGPGRYDPRYEEQGSDYPFPYVRWTEGRNFQAYLELLAAKKINLQPLIQETVPIAEAEQAYQRLQEAKPKPLILLLTYEATQESLRTPLSPVTHVSDRPVPCKKGLIRMAVVGASTFAKEVHLPNLARLTKQYRIHAVVSRSPDNAKQVAAQYGARYATTDYAQVLQDPEVDAVLIATRHHLHAPMAIEAARAGKAVFLEKPMALHPQELQALTEALGQHPVPFAVGFNRRFSPFAVEAKEFLSAAVGPCMVSYRVNTGYLHPHWIHSPEGGGRIIGEACHMLDLFQFFTGSRVCDASVQSLAPSSSKDSPEDNFVFALKYEDGSLCLLAYTSLGPAQAGREWIEGFQGGRSFRIDDFYRLTLCADSPKQHSSWVQQKGYLEEWMAFYGYLKGDRPVPISLDSLIGTTALSFLLARMISMDGIGYADSNHAPVG